MNTFQALAQRFLGVKEEKKSAGFIGWLSNTYENIGITDSNRPPDSQAQKLFLGIFFRALTLRSNGIATAMSKAVVERRVGQDEYQPVEDNHGWVRLLKNPHSHHVAMELWRFMSLTKDLLGSADFVVVKNERGVPVQLQPLFPFFGKLNLVPSPDGGIKGYIFHRNDGQKLNYMPEEVIRNCGLNPFTPYESMSLLQSACYQLDQDLYGNIYSRDDLKKGGLPKAFLKTDQNISEVQAKQWSEMFRASYMGNNNVDKIPAFGQGLGLHSIQVSSRDMAFVERKGLNKTDILQICGVPEGMISDSANRANAMASQVMFFQQTIQPEADEFAEKLTHSFEKIFGTLEKGSLRIRIPELAPKDPDFEHRKNIDYLLNGVMSINEVRLRENGLGVAENADKLMIQGGRITLNEALSKKKETTTV